MSTNANMASRASQYTRNRDPNTGRGVQQANQPENDNGAKPKKPPAQIWLNVGYLVAEGTEQERFVSLATGIPLDHIEKLSTRSSNADFAMFQAARNDLHEQIMEQANTLKPGESFYIHADGGLSMQIRRVNDELAEAPAVDPNTNPFIRRGIFVAAA